MTAPADPPPSLSGAGYEAGEAPGGAAVQLSGVKKTIQKKTIIDEFDLQIRHGEHLVLTGPSGAGKTTILRLIAGLDTPESGQIFVSGKPASLAGKLILPPHKRKVAMVFQDLGLWPHLSVSQNVLLAIPKQRAGKKTRMDLAAEALQSCEAAELAHRKINTLSGGQAQRVALARAVASNPNCLLLDEPFAGIDLPLKNSLFSLLEKFRSLSEKLAIVTVTHSPQDALALRADRIAVMDAGALSEELTMEEFRNSTPSSPTLQCWKANS